MTSKRNPKPEGLTRPERPSTAPPPGPAARVELEVTQANALASAAELAGRQRFYLLTVHERSGSLAPTVLAFLHEPTWQEVRDALEARRAEATVQWAVTSTERLEKALNSLPTLDGRAPSVLRRAFDVLEMRLQRDVTGLGHAPERWPTLELNHDGLMVSFQIHAGGGG